MTDETDLELKFGADASQVEEASAETQAAIAAITSAMGGMTAAVQEMTRTTAEGFAAMVAAEKEAAEELEELEEATEREALSLTEMAASAREGLESLNELRESVTGLGELFMAAFAIDEIKEFVEHMGEAQEKVEHTAEAFGMTTGEVQRYQAIFTAAGAGPDALATSMMRLDRASSAAVSGNKRAADAFTMLGVDLSQPMTPAQRLQAVLQGFANIEGPDKAAVAMAVFGRNIQSIAPLLGLTDEALSSYNEQIERYGLENDDAVAKGAALGASLNSNRNAANGLNNVLTQALAPTFTVIVNGLNDMIAGFIASYKEGGAAKTSLDALVFSMDALVSICVSVAVGIDYVVKTLDGFVYMVSGGVVAVLELAIGVFRDATVAAVNFGRALGDAASGNFSKVGDDLKAGLAGFADTGHKAAADFKAGWDQGSKEWASADKDYADTDAFLKRLWNPPKPGEKPEEAPQAGTPPKLGGEKNPPKDKSKMSALEEGFEAFEAERTANGTMLTNEYQDRLDYWNKVKAGTTLSVADQTAVQKKILEAQVELNKQSLQNTLATSREAAATQIAQANSDLAAQKASIAEQIKTIQTAMKDKTVSYAAGTAQIKALLLQESADEQATAEKIYAIRVASDELIIAHAAEGTKERQAAIDDETKAWQAMETAKQAATNAANKAINAVENEALAQRIAGWQKYYTRIGDFARTNTEALIEEHETFAQFLTKSWEGLLDLFLQWVEKQLVQWIATETAKTGATSAANLIRQALGIQAATTGAATGAASSLAQINSAAAVAAANAFAATAAIPIIGPVLAPEAAAAADAAVLSFSSQVAFSARGGIGEVANDGDLFQLHAKETVLPADIAVPLRSAVKSWGANGSPTASSLVDSATQNGGGNDSTRRGGGDTYNMQIGALDSRSIRRTMDNPRNVRAAAGAWGKHR